MFIPLYFIMLMTNNKECSMIGISTQDYLLLTLAVGPPTGLLIDQPPETVYFLHQVLCWNLLCCPLCFLLLKVQDFLNMKCEE